MNNFICLDTSVLVKLLVEEEDTQKALSLMEDIVLNGKLIVLPPFAWAEVGSVLRKMQRRNELTADEAEELWVEFSNFSGIEYLSDDKVAERAWKISRHFDMPTLYDSAFLAVAEAVTERTGEICEYWTADEKLINVLGNRMEYVRYLKNFV